MKITEDKLRKIVRQVLLENRDEILSEGWFTGALKGMARALPFGNEIVDARAEQLMEQLGEKIEDIDQRLKKLESRLGNR